MRLAFITLAIALGVSAHPTGSQKRADAIDGMRTLLGHHYFTYQPS